MSDMPQPPSKEAAQASPEGSPSFYHAYETHRIPWYVRAMWIGYWIGCIWYVVKYAIPMARNYF